MKTIYINNVEILYEDISELSEVLKNNNIFIGSDCRLESGCRPITIYGIYKYTVSGYIEKSNEQRVQMGCYNRTRKEWEDDFWNNPEEFTDHESLESRRRLFAFQTICNILDNSPR